MTRFFKALKTYANFYRECITSSLALNLQFRFNFIFAAISDLFFTLTYFGTAEILYNKISHIGNIDKNTFMLTMAYFNFVLYTTTALCAPSYYTFGELLRTGKFDYNLVKPVNIIFISLFCCTRFSTILTWWMPTLALYYYGNQYRLSQIEWFLITPVILIGITTYMLFNTMIMSLTFWLYRSEAVNFLRVNFVSIAKWPRVIYSKFFQALFTFTIPILTFSNLPIEIITTGNYINIIFTVLLVNIIQIALTKYMWRLGLRQYESVS